MVPNYYSYKNNFLNCLEKLDKIIWFVLIFNLQYLIWQFSQFIVFPWLWLIRFPLTRLSQWLVFGLASLMVDIGLGWPLGMTWLISLIQQLIINYLTLGARQTGLRLYRWFLILVNLVFWWFLARTFFNFNLSLASVIGNGLLIGVFLYFKLKDKSSL